jgi:hypothetical protein
VHETFSQCYWIFVIEADAADSGMYALARRRSYAVLYHKADTQVLMDPAQVYMWLSAHVRDVCRCWSPDDLFVASPEELRAALEPLAHGKGLTFEEAAQDFTCLLSEQEMIRLQRYHVCLGFTLSQGCRSSLCAACGHRALHPSKTD